MKNNKLVRRNGPWVEVLSRFSRNRLAMLGTIILILLILSAIFANVQEESSTPIFKGETHELSKALFESDDDFDLNDLPKLK